MRRLYLLRHGIAVPSGTPGFLDDDERPLTPEGEARMRQVGRGLRRLRLEPDQIISSPAARAWRTAEIVARALGSRTPIQRADALRPGRPAESIRDWLADRGEDRLMIVGHDPAFTDLVRLLTTGQTGAPICTLRKGGIAAFAARPDGSWALDWLARPRLLRGLGR